MGMIYSLKIWENVTKVVLYLGILYNSLILFYVFHNLVIYIFFFLGWMFVH